MLITKKYNKNDVVTIKLATGEEVVGYYCGHDDDSITLRKPVTPVPTQEGRMALAPFLMSSDYMQNNEELDFNTNTVVVASKTNQAFADAYTQQVSGLDLSPAAGGKPGLIKA